MKWYREVEISEGGDIELKINEYDEHLMICCPEQEYFSEITLNELNEFIEELIDARTELTKRAKVQG